MKASASDERDREWRNDSRRSGVKEVARDTKSPPISRSLFRRSPSSGALSQGIDSQSEQSDVLLSVHGLVDSLYIKKLAKKTHRGLEGRALLVLCTGGRCFGYDNIGGDGHVRQQINPSEAAIVQRIFEMAADGGSLKVIAKKLNDESVRSPRPRAGKRYATWCPTAIRAMLRRELYTGRVVWNRSRFVKAPGSNKRLGREGCGSVGRQFRGSLTD